MRQIEKILQELAVERNLAFQSFAKGWIVKFDQQFVTGYHFPVNNAAASRLCDDKSATYECLRGAGLAAVPHYFFMEKDNARLAKIRSASGELVLKPNNGSGGLDVVRAASVEEVFKAAETILAKSNYLAVSPYLAIDGEFRVVMLNGEVQLMYRKQIQSGWKHNLGLGALAEPIEDNDEEEEALADLAQRAVATLDITFASVDIVKTAEGLKVLEVNSGVMMEHFSLQSDDNYQSAKEIYRKALNI